MVSSRQQQVEKALPLSALDLPTAADDTSIGAIALQAERVELDRGELWEMMPDSCPSGPHISILTKGNARLESEQDGRYITSLSGRALVLEGLASKYKAQLRAETKCVGYRMRKVDMMLAAANADKVPQWMNRFNLMEKDEFRRLQMKLVATKGAIDGCGPHPSDGAISEWKKRKEKAVTRSERLREERCTVPPSAAAKILMLPPVAYDHRSTCSLTTVSTSTKGSRLTRGQSAPELRKQLVGEKGRLAKADTSPYRVLDFEAQILAVTQCRRPTRSVGSS